MFSSNMFQIQQHPWMIPIQGKKEKKKKAA